MRYLEATLTQLAVTPYLPLLVEVCLSMLKCPQTDSQTTGKYHKESASTQTDFIFPVRVQTGQAVCQFTSR